MTASLLPSNATARELAVEQVSAERWNGVDPGLIRAFKDPFACPAHLLPFLAFELGVDVWSEPWPEWRKRLVISQQIKLHRIKGTLAGLKAYAALADAEVVRAIVPPGTLIASAGPTPEEMERFKRLMPQIRIYPQAQRSHGGWTLFVSAGRRSTLWKRFASDAGAIVRSRPRVVVADNDVKTPVAITEVETLVPYLGRVAVQRISLPAKRKRGVTYAGVLPSRFAVTVDTSKRVASFVRSAGASSILRPGLVASQVDPELVFPQGRAGRAFFAGQRPLGHFYSGADAALRVYERIVFWDPTRVPRQRKASYYGVSRYGVAPYTAELAVDIPSKRPRRAMTMAKAFAGRFAVRHSDERFRLTMQALRSAKAQRDQIAVNTTTYRSPQAGTLIVAGTPFIAGRLLRS